MSRIDLFEQWKEFDYLCIAGRLPGITGNYKAVYFALLSINNSTYWSEMFDVDFMFILNLSKVDKDTYRRAMDFFNEKGLFESYVKGTNKYVRARISLKVLCGKPTGNTVGNTANKPTGNTVGNTVAIAHINKTVNNKPEKLKTFVQPSLDDVEGFFKHGLSSDIKEAARFYNYYQSNGWFVGKRKMRDWHAAARNWLDNAEAWKKPDMVQKYSGPENVIPIKETATARSNRLKMERQNGN